MRRPLDWNLVAPAFAFGGLAPSPSPNNALRPVLAACRRYKPDVLILADGHRFAWRAAALPFRMPPTVAIDMRTARAVLHPQNRTRHGCRTLAKASVSLLLDEVWARRRDARFMVLNGQAEKVGTRRLRDATTRFDDPLERLPESISSDIDDDRRGVILPGLMAPRKGFDLLISAMEALASEDDAWRHRPIYLAGATSSSYVKQMEELITRATTSGLMIHDLGFQSLQEISDLLATGSLVVLPYRQHPGGSGFLGSILSSAESSIVCSDYGWLGDLARKNGVMTFRDGDSSDLATSIRDAWRMSPRILSDCPIGYQTESSFGDDVWRAVEAVVGAVRRP